MKASVKKWFACGVNANSIWMVFSPLFGTKQLTISARLRMPLENSTSDEMNSTLITTIRLSISLEHLQNPLSQRYLRKCRPLYFHLITPTTFTTLIHLVVTPKYRSLLLNIIKPQCYWSELYS